MYMHPQVMLKVKICHHREDDKMMLVYAMSDININN